MNNLNLGEIANSIGVGIEPLKNVTVYYPYHIPQFILNKEKKNHLNEFHKIDYKFNIYEKSFNQLKNLLDINKLFLKNIKPNMDLNLKNENNIIFNNLNKDDLLNNYVKGNKINLLNYKNKDKDKDKDFFGALNNYSNNNILYPKIINQNLFIHIFEDFEFKNTFINCYKKLKHNELNLNDNFGLLSLRPIYELGNIDNNNNNNSQFKKENFFNKKYVTINNINNNENKNIKEKIINKTSKYKNLYKPYEYSNYITKLNEDINNYLNKFCDITDKLGKKNYNNIYELSILVLDQEYNLINMILHLNNLKYVNYILKNDNNIRNSINKNILLFNKFLPLKYNKNVSSSSSSNDNNFDFKEFNLEKSLNSNDNS